MSVRADHQTPKGGRLGGLARAAVAGRALRASGRILVWAFLALALVRGVGAILEEPSEASTPSGSKAQGLDSPAGAFAADFTRAYLSFDPRRPEADAAELGSYLTDALDPSELGELPESGVAQSVSHLTVVGERQLQERRSLVTVQARVESGGDGRTLHLAVPVAASADGAALAVYDRPAIAPAPRLAQAEAEETSALAGEEAQEIESLLERFFATYLADRSSDLAFFVPPDRRVDSPGSRFQLVSLDSVEQVGEGEGPRRVVLAALTAADPVSGATYGLRYRVGLERRDRWYVAELNTTQGGT